MTERKEVQDNLGGVAGVQPVTLQSSNPRVMVPAITKPPSLSDGIVGSLAKWSSGKIKQAGDVRHRKAALDGQMAHHQGKTFEEVEMAGDKFALEGFRVVEAQKIASGLLLTQQQEIENGAYEDDPDNYRANFMRRAESVLSGAGDQRTRELAQEQLLKQLPTLAENQMVKHLEWKEQQNFDSLASSIDVISRDPSSVNELVLIAQGGEGSPTAGLSDARRGAATVAGVIRAFENNNPLAYAALANKGLLSDNLTTAQIGQVRAARKSFENRRRSEYDADLFNGERALMSEVENGNMDPTAAVEALSVLYADHHIEMNASEAGQIYTEAESGVKTKTLTNAIAIDEAILRRDYDTVADLSVDAMIHFESGGRDVMGQTIKFGANAGDRAVGKTQTMPKTLRDPGFGVTPAKDNSFAEAERVGRDYWKAMVNRYDGDIEATAIAYNAGPKNADAWVKAGRDYSVLPDRAQTEPYAKKIAARVKGQHVLNANDRYAQAKSRLDAVRERVAMDTYEQTAPLLAGIDADFQKGVIDHETWRAGRDEVYNQYNVARTKADVNHEVSVTQGVIDAIDDRAAKAQQEGIDAQQLVIETNAREELAIMQNGFDNLVAKVERGEADPSLLGPAMAQLQSDRKAVMTAAGIDMVPSAEGVNVANMAKQIDKAIPKAMQFAQDQVLIEEAISTGTLGGLDANLQKRATEQHQQQVMQTIQDGISEGNIDEATAGAMFETEMAKFYAKSGTVDTRLQRVITGAMKHDWLQKDGTPNPYVVDALSTFREIHNNNPDLAARYIQDKVQRDRAIVALDRAAGGPLKDVVGGMGTVGELPSYFANPAEAVNNPEVQRQALLAAKNAINETIPNVVHSAFSARSDMMDIFNRTTSSQSALAGGYLGVDPENSEAGQVFINQVLDETQRVMTLSPGLAPAEAARVAGQNVQQRGAFIGEDFIMAPEGESMRERFFGAEGQNVDVVDPFNAAIMQFLRSDTAREAYPFLDNASIGDMVNFNWEEGILPEISLGDMGPVDLLGVATSGVRPFRTRMGPQGQIMVDVLDRNGTYHDPIVIDEREVGKSWLKTWKGTRSEEREPRPIQHY